MKEEIKELRLKIDGLSQLVKPLRGESKYLINIKSKPEHLDVENWMKIFEQRNYLFVNSNDEMSRELTQSNEIQKCYDSLILAKAWLGKMLGELGEATPYANDGNRKEVKDIEPAADTYEVKLATTQVGEISVSYPEYSALLGMNHIEKVDWLRTEIEKVINEVKQIGNAPNPPMLNREISIARTNAYNHLCEARFWLGFELQRIKENK